MSKKEPSSKKYNPILLTLGNILLLGAPYFFMNLYKRFFFTYGTMFFIIGLEALTNMVPWGNIASNFSTAFTFILFPIVITDTYLQATKLNKGEISQPKWKRTPAIIGLLTMLVFVIAYFAFLRFVHLTTPSGPLGESLWEERQENKEQEQRKEDIYAKYSPLQDEKCNSYRDDPSLKFGKSQFNYIFTEYCYFKKAVETNDPQYCNQYHEKLGFNYYCIAYFAIVNDNPKLCDEMSENDSLCHYEYEDQENPMRKPCKNLTVSTQEQMTQGVMDICKEFSEFHDSLELK